MAITLSMKLKRDFWNLRANCSDGAYNQESPCKTTTIYYFLARSQNAFGEVRHNLINEIFNQHHVPTDIKNLIKNLYKDFQTSIITSEFTTP